MPFLEEQPSRRGLTLPPSGWVLTILLVIYIFVGLIGHDPWKNDDAISLGIAWDIAKNDNWLLLQVAGRVYPDAPLYYWFAALSGKLFSWLLPFHDAARMASGLFTLLALEFILLAARELYGRQQAATAPLILAGSIGFLFHAHEAQPMLAALTAHTAAYWGLALLPRRKTLALSIIAGAFCGAFLANGFLPVLTLVPALLVAAWQSSDRARTALALLVALVAAAVPSVLWLYCVSQASPEYAAGFLSGEWASLTRPFVTATNLPRYLGLLTWYAWPALPLACWSLWSRRRQLADKEIAFPGLAFVAVLLLLGVLVPMRSPVSLLLLPPLVLLAVPGTVSLRRGAASAFDWFGRITFTFFAAIVWVGWSALVFGWPERLARQAVRLQPGFVGNFNLAAFLFALTCTGIWFWLIATTPRSPMRSIMHWMCGLTLFWLLLVSLWMPWIDYGKSYRTVSSSLAGTLPAKVDCIAGAGLPLSFLAVLDYREGIRVVPQRSDEASRCSWLLAQGDVRDPDTLRSAGWHKTWEGNRPGDRRADDKFHLYRRNRSGNPASDLTDIGITSPEPPEAIDPKYTPAPKPE